jgi:hypothetical protein
MYWRNTVRSYLIDEINPNELQKLLSYLNSKGHKGTMESIYWLQLPQELLSPEQDEHSGECGPFICTLETGPSWLKAELLIRGRGKLRCSCIQYASPEQRRWLIAQIDDILQKLNIPV